MTMNSSNLLEEEAEPTSVLTGDNVSTWVDLLHIFLTGEDNAGPPPSQLLWAWHWQVPQSLDL